MLEINQRGNKGEEMFVALGLNTGKIYGMEKTEGLLHQLLQKKYPSFSYDNTRGRSAVKNPIYDIGENLVIWYGDWENL